jgi:putative ABC transport system ATP-binding protein
LAAKNHEAIVATELTKWKLSNDQLADFRLNTIGCVFQDDHLFSRLTTAHVSPQLD